MGVRSCEEGGEGAARWRGIINSDIDVVSVDDMRKNNAGRSLYAIHECWSIMLVVFIE